MYNIMIPRLSQQPSSEQELGGNHIISSVHPVDGVWELNHAPSTIYPGRMKQPSSLSSGVEYENTFKNWH